MNKRIFLIWRKNKENKCVVFGLQKRRSATSKFGKATEPYIVAAKNMWTELNEKDLSACSIKTLFLLPPETKVEWYWTCSQEENRQRRKT